MLRRDSKPTPAIPPTIAPSDLVGLTGSYLQMRNVPQNVKARIEHNMGRGIAQELKTYHHPGMAEEQGIQQPNSSTIALALEDLVETGTVSDELKAAFEETTSPFSGERCGAEPEEDAVIRDFFDQYTNEGRSDLMMSPHELLYPWNIGITPPSHVLPSAPAPAVRSAALPPPAPAASSQTSSRPGKGRTPSGTHSDLVKQDRPSPSPSASASPMVSTTPVSDGRVSRPSRGKRRIALDAPIQSRTYHGASRTSVRTLPRGFEKNLEPDKVAGFKRAIEAVEEGDDEEDDRDLIENVTSKVMQKRVKNTLAARKSRARRAEYLETLERRLADKDERVQELERVLMEKETEIQVLKAILYEDENNDEGESEIDA
ncbi:hypothetical protein DACRYDRAFT_115482 [Dacryopinax primogenitus]|uniref:BZIP domain-containing protein n=1 Tax=Dacryopinax primogenitus (strain DJM 731) TaxID=1858805 RepID=M5GEI2_DACPD|nr:uncharacterized protein DACRYDRAFT_115482 [Dacryopinax primogenitus]EJU03278.1 hypothetical protein DACRYDRAFT_115482 [Dacryopinax primogenitus]